MSRRFYHAKLSVVAWAALGFGLVDALEASPTFFLGPGPDPAGDVAWRTAAGEGIVEFDLDEYNHLDPIDALVAGNLSVDLSLRDPISGGSLPEASFGTAWDVGSWWAIGGGQYGTVWNTALLNRRPSGPGSEAYREVVFSFSTPVPAFGTWVFDDSDEGRESFQMIARDMNNDSWTSGILDANPGATNWTVEGFVGVTSPVGLTEVAIRVSTTDFGIFELDHIQLVVPEPATIAMLSLAGVGLLRKKKP